MLRYLLPVLLFACSKSPSVNAEKDSSPPVTHLDSIGVCAQLQAGGLGQECKHVPCKYPGGEETTFKLSSTLTGGMVVVFDTPEHYATSLTAWTEIRDSKKIDTLISNDASRTLIMTMGNTLAPDVAKLKTLSAGLI